MRTLKTQLATVVVFTSLSLAASPPALINYQGILRSSTNVPLSGTYDMVFRFFTAGVGGDEILVDRHTAANGSPVSVSGGAFGAQLGGGVVSDGAGPGTYTSLADVFRDYGSVYLSIQVGAETLVPRTRIVSTAYAANANNLDGRGAASFLDVSSTAQTKYGPVTAFTATSMATVGGGTAGIDARGMSSGGYFQDANDAGYAYVGTSGAVGIEAYGNFCGGYFKDANNSGSAYVGWLDTGIFASGNTYGGNFQDANGSGYAHVGSGDTGIEAYGYEAGGFFQDTNSSATASVAYGDYGILASALSTGVIGYGDFTGGFFADTDSSGYANVGTSTYKISGAGAVSFVQNHPTDKGKVIVYAAPEGDEVATYTRGTARLVDGVARVPLGETFAWVTNPDIGLTAYLTPVGGWADLYIDSKSPKEIVVRSRDPKAADLTFDYIVYGLRIGFEETSIVQEKQRESLIPSMKDHQKRYEHHPELRPFNALERFKGMRAAAGETEALDLTASKVLHDTIGEYDPAVHGPVGKLPGFGPPPPSSAVRGPEKPSLDGMSQRETAAPSARPLVEHSTGTQPMEPPIVGVGPAASERAGPRFARSAGISVRVSEPVEAGDVLVVDREQRGAMRLGDAASDRALVGIVTDFGSPSSAYSDEAPLANVGEIVSCKVDAGFGAIRVGDLLTTSPTRGHAMRSTDAAAGTIVGKALEDFEVGTGMIRVLVMLR